MLRNSLDQDRIHGIGVGVHLTYWQDVPLRLWDELEKAVTSAVALATREQQTQCQRKQVQKLQLQKPIAIRNDQTLHAMYQAAPHLQVW